ncbi:hypothetical protein MRB53_006251 [Persea americana]|uniref:Uncharacterized protein n=1 Tax=Persea americana TaxID=3435 RepID=A0ACC2MGI8_PERAE|nr:hypothetical protein MRB53_006251 [Persea americana]
MALRGKAAEIESALVKQEARLKEEFLAEHDTITEEEVGRLSADYKAELPGIRDRAWELGFSCSDSKLAAVSQASVLPSQSCPEANAVPGAPQEAPAVSADPEGCQVAAVVEVPPEDVAVVPEAAPTATEASAVVAEVPPEIDCNVEAAAF